MKRLKKVAYSAVFAAGAVHLAACTPTPESVYGPPPTQNVREATAEYSRQETTSYSPSEEIPEDVYGPPEFFEEETVEETVPETAEETAQETAEAVTEEFPKTVYGPPEYFEQESEESGAETSAAAKGGEFQERASEVTEEVPVCVYGPPEYFEGVTADPETESAVPETETSVSETAEIQVPEDTRFDPDDERYVLMYGPPVVDQKQ